MFVNVEVERAAFVSKIFRDGSAVQDLVVAGVEAQVGAVDDSVGRPQLTSRAAAEF